MGRRISAEADNRDPDATFGNRMRKCNSGVGTEKKTPRDTACLRVLPVCLAASEVAHRDYPCPFGTPPAMTNLGVFLRAQGLLRRERVAEQTVWRRFA